MDYFVEHTRKKAKPMQCVQCKLYCTAYIDEGYLLLQYQIVQNENIIFRVQYSTDIISYYDM